MINSRFFGSGVALPSASYPYLLKPLLQGLYDGFVLSEKPLDCLPSSIANSFSYVFPSLIISFEMANKLVLAEVLRRML